MPKKNKLPFIIIGSILALIILILIAGVMTGKINMSGAGASIFGTNICASFTENYPDYFIAKKTACEGAGGQYVCESAKAGCYEIASWDSSTGCVTAEFQILKNMCASMGGLWTCNAQEASCERI